MKKLFLVALMLAGSAWAFKDCPECPEMVVIPAGSFMMGSPPPASEQDDPLITKVIRNPRRRVNIQLFAIGKYGVTQEQWYAAMGNNPSSKKDRTLPVGNVSWDDAQLFVQKLSQKTGKKYRLPAEAEWEYAAREGSATKNPVGLEKPNQFGLYDMSGNVWEWTQDCWHDNYSGAPTDGSGWTSGDCSDRVVRGGSWPGAPKGVRITFRVRQSTAVRYGDFGFRVARDL